MKIDKELLDNHSAQAKSNPWLCQSYDLRTTPKDNSSDTQCYGIRNYTSNSSTWGINGNGCRVERENQTELFYDEVGQQVKSFIVSLCSDVMGFSVELGRWHNTECRES